jgi:hypothetical protein
MGNHNLFDGNEIPIGNVDDELLGPVNGQSMPRAESIPLVDALDEKGDPATKGVVDAIQAINILQNDAWRLEDALDNDFDAMEYPDLLTEEDGTGADGLSSIGELKGRVDAVYEQVRDITPNPLS